MLALLSRIVLCFCLAFVSDSAAAVTIINLPQDEAPATIGADTIVNVLPGGVLDRLEASDNAIVNVLGGSVDVLTLTDTATVYAQSGGLNDTFSTSYGGLIYHSGGRTETISLGSNSFAEVTGGAIGTIKANSSSNLILAGVEFALDGIPVAGLDQVGDSVSLDIAHASALTATLADGTAFGYYKSSWSVGTGIDNGTLTLRRSAAPPTQTPGTTLIDTVSELTRATHGQILQVVENGELQKLFRAGPGSRVEVNGGRVRSAFQAIDAELVINSGTVDGDLKAFGGSTIEVNGGLLQNYARIYHDSVLNIHGGNTSTAVGYSGSTINLLDGSVNSAHVETGAVFNMIGGTVQKAGSNGGKINILGGSILDSLKVSGLGAEVEFSGGRHTDNISTRTGGKITFRGSDIRINGAPSDLFVNPGDWKSIWLIAGDVLSGIYPDGTPFVFWGEEGNTQTIVKIVVTETPAIGPSLIQIPSDPLPNGVRNGQTLILNDGGALPDNYTAGEGSTVEIQGGTVGKNFEVIGSAVNITGGIQNGIDAFSGSVVNMTGDIEWYGMHVFDGATANFHGGNYSGNNYIQAFDGATVNINDGSFNGFFEAEGSTVNISGGIVSGLKLSSGSTLQVTDGTISGLSVSNAGTHAEIHDGRVGPIKVERDAEVQIHTGLLSDTGVSSGTLQVRGGALGDSHKWLGGTVELVGYDFQIDGVPIPGLDSEGQTIPFNYTPGSMLTAVLSDGTPLNIVTGDNFQSVTITDGVLNLTRSAVPTLPSAITIPSDPAPYGAAPGQTVTLNTGGQLDENFTAAQYSIVNINDGTVGNNFEADRSQVTIAGGTVGDFMDVFSGATVYVSGGTVGTDSEVHAGGTLNLQGGTLGRETKVRGGTLNVTAGTMGSQLEISEGGHFSLSGGFIYSSVSVRSGSTANISGGEIERDLILYDTTQATVSGGSLGFDAQSGSTLIITGGAFDGQQYMRSGATVDIAGGNFDDGFYNWAGDQLTIRGLDFEINGTPIAGLSQPNQEMTVTIEAQQAFTGTFADGNPFAFTSSEYDRISTVHLVRSADLPPSTANIQVPSAPTPYGIHSGQTLTLTSGGALPKSFNAGRGSVVNIQGGTVGNNFEASAAVVNISGGEIGEDLSAFHRSEFNITGGTIHDDFTAYPTSTVNIAGGTLSSLNTSGTFNMSGGSLGSLISSGSASRSITGGNISVAHIGGGSQLEWHGGTILTLYAGPSTEGSSVNIFGVDFQLNGVTIPGLENPGDSIQFDLTYASYLTGILSDGSPLLLSELPVIENANIRDGALTLTRSADPSPLLPASYHISDENAPFTVAQGQTLTLVEGGVLQSKFIAGAGSVLNILGGNVNSGFQAFQTQVNIDGGTFSSLAALSGATLNINAGALSTCRFSLYGGSHTNIRGGGIANPVTVDSGATIDIYATSFLLDGQPIAELAEIGDSFVVPNRNGERLSATLLDGSLLRWGMQRWDWEIGFNNDATIRLHLAAVPEPTCFALFCLTGLLGIAYPRHFRH